MPAGQKPNIERAPKIGTRTKVVDSQEHDPRFHKPVPPTGKGRGQHHVNDEVKIPMRMGDFGSALTANTPVDELLDKLASFSDDFAGFVRWAFPWGEPGSSLEDQAGPEQWQLEQQERISQRIKDGGVEGCVVEEDVSSGHGVGKSAQVSWAILWAISTHADTRGVVTANTDTQLRTKTWAELAKWYAMFIGKQFFTLTATAIYIANDPVREKAWRIDQIPWSKTNTESFAGMHNLNKRILVIFDEASAIDDLIYEVTEGALTDAKTQIFWLRYGNPTRTSGKFFHNCVQGKRNTYTRVDSRTVSFSNKPQIQAWIDDYGEDSDFVRVRVKGEFPRAGFANFISPGLVMDARRRTLGLTAYSGHPKVLSIDPARFGDDSTVITLRQGQKILFQLSLNGFDGHDVAGRVMEICRKEQGIVCIAYDAIGIGAELDGVLKRIPQLKIPLLPISWGCPAKDDRQYFNMRSEAWGRMREWLETASIPDDDELANQLSSLSYGYDGRMRVQLQSKKDLKRDGGKSPDKADSIALGLCVDLIDRKLVTAKVRPVQRRTVVWTR